MTFLSDLWFYVWTAAVILPAIVIGFFLFSEGALVRTKGYAYAMALVYVIEFMIVTGAVYWNYQRHGALPAFVLLVFFMMALRLGYDIYLWLRRLARSKMDAPRSS